MPQADDVSMRIELTLDCNDLDRMTGFWRDAAGFVVAGRIEDRYVTLSGHQLTLTLQRVDEPKAHKNRMHLDLLVTDLDSEVRRLEGLGARRLTATPHEEFDQTWFVLADPEGNEFCLARDSEAPRRNREYP
jgi:predicted enzyme related to lactoylglutathione lyase